MTANIENVTDHESMARRAIRFVRRHLLYCWAAAAVLLQLWLTSEIRIIPMFAPHDMSNFVEHARSLASGMWFGGYDNLTLIKRPFFPMFLAGLQEFGIALPIGHTLLYASACLGACTAVRPVVRSQRLLAAIFIVLLFNPFTYNNNAWIANRSQVNPALALLVVSCAVAIYLRRSAFMSAIMPWTLGLGCSLAAFWLTREEAVWIVPTLVILLGAYIVFTVREERPELLTRLLAVVYPLLILAVSIALVMIINGIRYGWYIVEEQQAPEFVSAYNSLARIAVAPVPYVGVTEAARKIAYSVSPAARELEAPLEGPGVGRWKARSCRQPEMICGTDYSRGFFIWAFRDAVAGAGHYTSGAAARAYYLELAKEIDTACDARKIACLPKALTLSPPIHVSDLPLLFSNVLAGTQSLVTFAHVDLDPPRYTDPPPQLLSDYGVVVRSVADFPETISFAGWLLRKPMKSIVIKADDEQTTPLTFLPSPDVENVVTNNGPLEAREEARQMNPGHARFQFTLPCNSCSIVATDMRNVVTTIPLNIEHPDFRTDELILHLDTSTSRSPFQSGDDKYKNFFLRTIGLVYSALVPWCVLAAAAISIGRLAQWLVRRNGGFVDHAFVALAIGSGCGALILILGVVTTFSYFSFYPEYMSPLYPLLLFAFAFTFTIELQRVAAMRRSGAFSAGLSGRRRVT